MNHPFSTTIVAFERLTQDLREALKETPSLDTERTTHWMSMALFHCTKIVLPFEALDVFDAVYALHHADVARGEVSSTDHALLDIYIDGSANIALQAGLLLTRVVHCRANDDTWFENLWNEGDKGTKLLQTNLRHYPVFTVEMLGTVAKIHEWLNHLAKDNGREEAFHLFGPWNIAARWVEGISKGRLLLRGIEDAKRLQQSLWLYVKLDSQAEKINPARPVASNALVIQELLNAVPLSIVGALVLYVLRMQGQTVHPSMDAIFNFAGPTADTTSFFKGLLLLKSRYDEVPYTGHPWLKAQLSWPSLREMLVMFTSLYPDNDAASENIVLLSNAFEKKDTMSAALPCLD